MRWVTRVSKTAALVAGLWTAGAPSRAVAAPGPYAPPLPAVPGTADLSSALDVNQIHCQVSNLGVLGYDLYDGHSGFEWPQGSSNTPFYSIGLWLVGEIFGTPRTVGSAIADYSSEFNPGPANSKGPVDPSGTNPDYRVYKISRDDLVNPGPDYLAWPVVQGAPADAQGHPLLLGDQTLFSVYNDADPRWHTKRNGNTSPLGVEVRQTVYAFNRPFDLSSVMIVKYEIQNRSIYRLPELFVGLWMDPDLGDPDDDFTGCDTTAELAYAFDGPFGPDANLPTMPAAGAVLLSDSLAGRPSLGLRAMVSFPSPLDPNSFAESVNLARGLTAKGEPWMCGDQPTRFPYAGDPTSACRDTVFGDKRILMSVGPYDVNPNATVAVTVAYLVATDPRAETAADNVAALRRSAELVRNAWRDHFSSLPAVPQTVFLGAPFPNPFQDVVQFELQLPRGVEPPRELQVLDVRGRMVWRETVSSVREGYNRIFWSGRSLGGVPAPAGVYQLRLLTDRGPLLFRAVRLH